MLPVWPHGGRVDMYTLRPPIRASLVHDELPLSTSAFAAHDEALWAIGYRSCRPGAPALVYMSTRNPFPLPETDGMLVRDMRFVDSDTLVVLMCRADQPTELTYGFIIQQDVLRRYSLDLQVDKSAVAYRGRLVALGCQNGGVRVVDVLGGFQTVRKIGGIGGPVTALAFDAESDALFIARGSQMYVWPPEQRLRRLYRLTGTGTGEIRLMVGTPGAAVAIAFQSPASRIVSGVTLVPAHGPASRLRFDGLIRGTLVVLTGAASNGRALSFTRTNLEVNRVELLTCEVPKGGKKRPRPREESPMLELR